MITLKPFFLIFMISLLISCGGKDKKTDESNIKEDQKAAAEKEETGSATPLEGKWVIKRAEGSMAEMNVGTAYIFKGSKLSFGKDGFLNPGTTEVTDSSFTFQADGNQYKFDYYYQFNGDTMVVRMKNGTQVFHLVKE
jgi:hypothetical protein